MKKSRVNIVLIGSLSTPLHHGPLKTTIVVCTRGDDGGGGGGGSDGSGGGHAGCTDGRLRHRTTTAAAEAHSGHSWLQSWLQSYEPPFFAPS